MAAVSGRARNTPVHDGNATETILAYDGRRPQTGCREDDVTIIVAGSAFVGYGEIGGLLWLTLDTAGEAGIGIRSVR
jgi:hypothetical protein